MPFAISVLAGPNEGEVYPLPENREILIGRTPTCNIFLRDKGVSRFHSTIVVGEGRCKLADLQSSNGTFVDGERMDACELTVGQEITVGETRLQIVETDEEGRPTTTAVGS